MINFEVKVTPELKTIHAKLNGLTQKSLDMIHFRLVEGANRIRNKMIYLMQKTPKTGKKYRRGKSPNIKWHIASAPDNAPAIDSGQLLRSITMREGIDEVEVGVKSGAPYARYLEEGTKKMQPRPFLAPAANSEIPRMQRRIISDLQRFKL